MSTESVLFQAVRRLEKSFNHNEIALGVFLEIERAFDNTFQSYNYGCKRARS
jgi:hypothetical protein